MNCDTDILVSVLCITYNHERYIRETLEGFLMQKTDFAFEVLIHEDASTDKTAEIVHEYESKYPDIFRVIYETENQYHKGIEYNHDLLAPMARGKYIALCEGDDAWIDDEKLQLQVDYMEKHPECSLTVHKAFLQYPHDWSGKREPRAMGYEKEGIVPFKRHFLKWSAATSSFLFRKELYMPMPEFFRKAPTGDEPLKFYLAAHGEVYYFDRVMSVYNRMSLGSWSAKFEIESFERRKAYYIGYINFFKELDRYLGLEHHVLFENCIKVRICRFMQDILLSCEKYDDMLECLESFARSCDDKWAAYVKEKKRVFLILDGEQQKRVVNENGTNKKIFVYGAGEIAKIGIRQLEEKKMPVEGVIISDGQALKKEFMGYPVSYLSEFLKREEENFIIMIALQEAYARTVMESLHEKGIEDYVWLYENICKVD